MSTLQNEMATKKDNEELKSFMGKSMERILISKKEDYFIFGHGQGRR